MREEVQRKGWRTRKPITLYKALPPPTDDIDKLYVSRKEGGRELTSTEESVNTSIRRLEDYIKKDQWNTNQGDQKQPPKHKDPQNNNS